MSLELGASLVATAGGALHAAAPVLATAIAHPTLLVLAGFAAGVLGGMLGIGGGILAVPALVYAAGLGQREAVATSLAAMVPMSLVAAARHHHYGNLRVREGGLLGVLGIAGAAVGASIAEVIPESALRVSFALLMIVIAVHLTHGVWKDRRAPNAGGAGG
ncbi:MAG: sulfite exporter TauE/SafE family protein [Solirubrobacteraceae bacterium]|nr:sulfite exporter TauE/SafE family protein [Patulibacter sp.]